MRGRLEASIGFLPGWQCKRCGAFGSERTEARSLAALMNHDDKCRRAYLSTDSHDPGDEDRS